MDAMQIVFLIAAFIIIFSAVMVVSVRKIMHAALWLIVTLFGVAGVFAMLESSFFTVVQVVVYVGAIAILIIFAIMLTRGVMDDDRSQLNKGWVFAAAAAALMCAGLVFVMNQWSVFQTPFHPLSADGGESIAAFGLALADPNGFVIPFEVASVLLLAALVGGMYIASDKKE
ncbi:MAG: NADH-quinone oxidoreductase subunit J [Anaerolineaceae bacterium]